MVYGSCRDPFALGTASHLLIAFALVLASVESFIGSGGGFFGRVFFFALPSIFFV